MKTILLIAISLFGTAVLAADELKSLAVTVPALVDAQGKTLYVFDADVKGIPSCYDQCETAWPPLLLKSIPARNLRAPIGSVQRKNGQLQITLNGRPLYYFFQDQKAGDIKGDGLGGVWHIVTTPGAVVKR